MKLSGPGPVLAIYSGKGLFKLSTGSMVILKSGSCKGGEWPQPEHTEGQAHTAGF